jgi:hypothetical protein
MEKKTEHPLFEPNNLLAIVLLVNECEWALCPDASLEMLWPSAILACIVSRGISAVASIRDLFRLSKLLNAFGKPCPPKRPRFIVQGVEVWTP